MFSAMKQVKQLKISGWPTIFGQDQKNLSFWPFLNDLNQLGSKTEKMGFLPKIANPQSKHSETTWFVAENINVPPSYWQNWHRKGQNIKKCHETTKITFNIYCETPCRLAWKFLENLDFAKRACWTSPDRPGSTSSGSWHTIIWKLNNKLR